MATQTLEAVEKAARIAHRVRKSTLKAIADRATREAEQRASARRSALKRKRAADALKHDRVRHALAGALALREIGISRAFADLLSATQQSCLIVWGGSKAISIGGDMTDVVWRFTAQLSLNTSALDIDCFTETTSRDSPSYSFHPCIPVYRITLPHNESSNYVRAKDLLRIATPHPIDFNEVDWSDVNDVYSTEMLFEMLVQCAEEQLLDRMIRKAINRR